ncbi:nuclear pore complex protein NUP1-like isoform X2 [Chenopodium quinoa]|uniref:nuclear pore complex protein NUP1-like isoform X2 n=1 Tax=Chenopodium quinoa TaxID=63459 RepID=UPI000B79ADDE|nr:nuclear pore complex protein NUP1-like isoform X2 [Chenopodium quinoa]
MASEASAGAGGKFRKKPFRRTQATPYDRPPTALRPTQLVGAAAERENNGWLSKLVDPASRLITAGAHKLFSSVFRKRLLPPPPPPPQSSHDETPEIVDEQPETTTNVGPSGNKEAVASKGNDPSRVSRSGEVADLEDILKQKTFTRSEIDHLTALLKSRTVDNLVENEKGSSEPNSSDEKAFHNRCEILTNYPANENGAERVLPAAITTPVTRSKVLEDVVASPAELAKAYMGSRPTRASPSVPREDLSASYNPFFQPKSPATSLIQKPANEIGAAANGFMTPRYRGRSAIYSMARTPYSRPHPTEVFKAAETSYGAHGASSSSHNATEIQQLSGSNRQVLKRRSSALESDIGFVGPIRRIRQKPNLLHYKALSQPVSGATHVKQGSGFLTDATEVPSSINGSANLRSSKALVDNDMHNTRYKSVPPQSIETARKIFQQLDKFSSKGKSPEKKFDIVGGSSSGKMATDMRDGLARKSMNTDSLKVLQTIEDSRKESGLVDSSNAPDQSLQISQRVEGSFHKSVPSVEEGEEAGRPTKALDFKNPRSNYDHPQKKRAFQMSAHEDYLELDDDVHANGVASTPFVKGVEDHELAKNSASISDNPQSVAISAGSPLAPELKSSTISSGSIKESPTDGFAAAQTFSGFSVPIGFSASLSTSTSTQAAVSYPLSTAEMNNVAGQTEKINDIIATSSNSASAKDIKSELPSSATEADGPDTVKKNTLHFGDVSKRMEGDPSSVANSAKGLFSFGTQSNGATLSNGLSSTLSGTMGVSSPVQTSSSSNDQVTVPVSVSSSPSPSLSVSNGNAVSTFSSVTSAGTMFSSATTGGLLNFGSSSSQFSTSTSAPSAFGSSFQFGSSAVLSTSASALESIAGPKSSETAVSNSIGGLFSVKPVETATVGNTISEFNASTSKSASGETQTAPPAFFSSASSSAVAFSSSTPNFSSQSASSPSSNIFGFSAPPSVNGSASVSIGSNHFTTGSGFVSSVGFPSVTAPVSSSSNTSSTIFGLQSSKPATSGSMFGSSSQITGFNFGSTASGTSGASNSTLIFGATSSSSAASISTPLVFGATSSTSAASNSNPNVFVAISSSPAANSGVFSFGAGSSTASVFSVPSAAASTSALSTTFSSQPAFASSTSPFAFGLTPPAGINDRMSMEDSMAEDSVQVSTPAAPVFGQPISAPSSNFVFNGAAAPSAGSPFQFSGQQNQFAPQNTPFQPSGSLEFNAGGAGSFSLGSGGVDKASRRIVKVKKTNTEKVNVAVSQEFMEQRCPVLVFSWSKNGQLGMTPGCWDDLAFA